MAPTPFVSTDWLAAHLADPGIVVVDGSWYLPTADRDPYAEYLSGHLPGAVFFDLDAITDPRSGLPHMLATPTDFARAAGALGISAAARIVVYDEDGLFSAPRVRWTFLTMGAADVFLLEGGGRKWRAEGRPIEVGPARSTKASFAPGYDAGAVIDLAAMKRIVADRSRQIVDARPAARFAGEAPEPRPGLRLGHMPGATSIPSGMLSENGVLKSPQALRQLAEAAGVDLSRPIVTTCGSGVTAAALKLALEQAGATDVVLYDGSWAEWGGRDDTPIES